MKKTNLVPLIAIALVVAIASTGLFYGLFVGRLRSGTGPTGTQPLVVTAKALPTGTALTEDNVKMIVWPGDAVPDGSYANVEQVVGATVIEPLGQGEPVLAARIAFKDGQAKSGLAIPQGFRAVSVHVTDSSGVLSLLRPGYQVDVQVVALASGNARVRTVLQHLTVLTVNPRAEQAAQGNLAAPVVTLLARPEEADILAVADAGARVRLLLRNPLDEGRPSLAPLALTSVLQGSGSPAPKRVQAPAAASASSALHK